MFKKKEKKQKEVVVIATMTVEQLYSLAKKVAAEYEKGWDEIYPKNKLDEDLLYFAITDGEFGKIILNIKAETSFDADLYI